MPYPNAYYNFLAISYSHFLNFDGERPVAKMPLLSPRNQPVVIGGQELYIGEHCIVIEDDLADDYFRANNFSYNAVLFYDGKPALQMQVAVDNQNFLNSNITLINIENSQSSTHLLPGERETLACLASFYTIPSMRSLHAKYTKFLQKISEEYFQEIKAFWGVSSEARKGYISGLVDRAKHIVALGGQDFVNILKRIEFNYQQESVEESLVDGDYLLVDDENEITSLQDSINSKNAHFRRYYNLIDFRYSNLKTYLAGLSVADLHLAYKNAIVAASCINDDEVIVSFEELKKIHLIISISIKVLLDKLERILISQSNHADLASFIGSPSLAYVRDTLLVLLARSDIPANLDWLIKHKKPALDLITQVNEGDSYSCLLEIALNAQQLDSFRLLLQSGANSMFVNDFNRCFAHDVIQANPQFARELVVVNVPDHKIRQFFIRLALVTEIWRQNVPLDPVEASSLDTIMQRYRSYTALENVEELSRTSDLFDVLYSEARNRTGLTKEQLYLYLVVENFQSQYRDFLIAYNRLKQQFSVINGETSVKVVGLIKSLFESLSSKPLLSIETTLGEKIKTLNKSINIFHGACDLIDKQKVYDESLLALSKSRNKATIRDIKQRNKTIHHEIQELEQSIKDFISSRTAREIRPSQGGFWSSLTSYVSDTLSLGSAKDSAMSSIFTEPFLNDLEGKKAAEPANMTI